MHKALALAAAVAAISGAASAQNTVLGQKAAVLDAFSATDVAAMMGEFGFKTELRQANGAASPSLVATTDGGAKFLVGFFDCADAAKPAGCKQMMVSTAQASGGVEFDDLNAFNGQSSVTTAVYEPSNQILIFGRNIFSPGGIGRDNFKLQVALFLNDMQTFVEGRRAGAKSVSMMKTPDIKSKITSITGGDDVAPEARRLMISADGSAEVEVAINNSFDVNFSAKK
ncbi:MAG: hypothetical protein U5J99_10650 [Parvularculaceae bacterium]|nr:hypothetical protein [Parvularculaceae bacterium]